MTNKDAIESFKHSNEQAKVRLEVEKMRMDNDEIKELEFYIERDEIAIKALEREPKTDSWSIKDVADTFKKHGLIREQEPCEDAISRQAAIDAEDSK